MNGDKELATPDPQTARNHAVRGFKDYPSEPNRFCPWCRKGWRFVTPMKDLEEDE